MHRNLILLCTVMIIDLVVYNNGTSESSAKAKSSTEMIYENLTSNPNYTMHIGRYSGTTSVNSAGYAWSTDNIRYFPKNYEGRNIFYPECQF